MKQLKFLLISILLSLFFLPNFVFAKTDPYIENLYMDVTINENGSITVKEIDSYVGSFNGVTAYFGYRNSNTSSFKGQKDDFYGSDIYNGSSITDLKVGDISKENLNFDSLFNTPYFYEEVYYASNGDYGVYIKNDDYDAIDLRVYSPSSKNKAIYYEYTINDMVVEHNDVAELAWTIFNGKKMPTSISNLEIRIHLPREDTTMRAWGHGVLQGYLDRNSDSMITLHAKDVGEYNDLGVRVMFDNNIVTASKKSNIDGKNYILEVEKEMAEEANRLRQAAKKKVVFVNIGCVLYLIIMTFYLIYTYIKYDKEYKYNLNNEYLREIPATYPPYVLEYLLKKNITSLSFSTTILDLIEKKVITVVENPNKKKDYILKLMNPENISQTERKVIDLIFNDIGNKNEVSINQIKTYGNNEKNAQNFLLQYRLWKADATAQAKEENFYESFVSIKVLGVFLSCIAGILVYLNIVLQTEVVLCYFVGVIGIVSFIYFIAFKKKSNKGIEHYTKWMAFKKFLKDFGRFHEKELPEIKLWEKYLVYAHILGVAKELEKEMKIKIEEMEAVETTPTFSDIYVMNRIIDMDLHRTITNSINHAVSASNATIAESRASSSGGIGGGFSGGGGSFGGGGGRGSF